MEKPNNPANKSLWQLVNQLSRWIKDQDDLIKDLQAGLVGAKYRVSNLEMSSSMIRSRVMVLEEAMEIDSPVMDLSGNDSTNSEYANVDDGGAMLVDDSENERDQENIVPIPIPPPVFALKSVRANCLATNTEYCDRCTHATTQATNVAWIKTEGTKGLLQGQVAGLESGWIKLAFRRPIKSCG